MSSLVCIKVWKVRLRDFWWHGRTIRRQNHSWIHWRTISTNNKHRRWWRITMIWFVNKINNWISTNRKNNSYFVIPRVIDRRSKISNKNCKQWKISTLCWRSHHDQVSVMPSERQTCTDESSRIRFKRRTEKHLRATATRTGVSERSHGKSERRLSRWSGASLLCRFNSNTRTDHSRKYQTYALCIEELKGTFALIVSRLENGVQNDNRLHAGERASMTARITELQEKFNTLEERSVRSFPNRCFCISNCLGIRHRKTNLLVSS